jgi:hypothetical protein
MTDLHGYLDFREMFREAMNPAFYNIAYLDNLIASGNAWFFRSDHAAIVVEIKQFPGGAKCVHGLVAAGDLTEIDDLIERAEAWGAINGCTHGLIESRPAWAKRMKSRGYEVFQVSIVKEL